MSVKRMHPEPQPTRPGQRSVWDFPRPAIVQPETARLRVEFANVVVAETTAGFRTLETSHPPSYYFPPGDVRIDLLQQTARTTHCEWKGQAHYYDVVVGKEQARNAAWFYPQPTADFACMAGYIAFYPAAMGQCWVNDEPAVAQPGGFYGGWISSGYAGPFKGVPKSHGW